MVKGPHHLSWTHLSPVCPDWLKVMSFPQKVDPLLLLPLTDAPGIVFLLAYAHMHPLILTTYLTFVTNKILILLTPMSALPFLPWPESRGP